MRHYLLTLLVALAGCAAAPAEPAHQVIAAAAEACTAAAADVRTLVEVQERPRACPRLPTLRLGASALERRGHAELIVRMYGECAGGEQP